MKKIIKSIQDVLNKLIYILTAEQKKYAVLLLGISFIGALLETLGVSAIVPLINAMMTPQLLLDNELVSKIFHLFNIQNTNSIVLIVGIGIILLYVFKNLFFIFMSWVRAKYTVKIQRELSVDMMKTYMNKGYRFFLTQNTGELMRGVFNDTSAICNILNYSFKLVVDFLTVLLICIYMLIADWVIAAAMACLMGVCMLIIYGYFKGEMQKSGQESRKYGAIVNQQAIQAFQGIKEVIVMRKQNFFIKTFEKARHKQGETSVSYSVGSESPAYIIEAICITGLLAIICIRTVFEGGGDENMFSTLSAFAVGAFRILPALGKICSGYNTIIFYMPSLNHMYKLLQETMGKEDDLELTYCLEEKDNGVVKEFKDRLEIKNICWKYSEETGDVLHNLNLTIRKGESIALIGQSGSGKTTLADIILGLLRPQSGQVTLDGRDIFSFGTEWGSIMGYVPQSVYLSDDSIKNNIAFGVNPEDIDDKRVWEALEQAQLKDVVLELDQKIDTPIGERGVRFSGGQRQRVAIARALYANPDILLLDEATAALDNETENAVMEAIEALQGKLTLIIIAHRLTTVRKCDKIFEIKDGVAVERDKAEILATANISDS